MGIWSKNKGIGEAGSPDLILEQLEERIVLDGEWQPVDGFVHEQIEDMSYFRQAGDSGYAYDVMFRFNHTTDQWYEHDGPTDNSVGTTWYAIGGAYDESHGSIVNGDTHAIASGLTVTYDSVENRTYWNSAFMGDFFYDFDHATGDHQWQQKVGTDEWELTGETSEIWYAYGSTPNDWALSDGWSYTKYGGSSYWRLSDGSGGYDAMFAYVPGTGQWWEHNGPTGLAYGSAWYKVGTAGYVPSTEGLLDGESHGVADGLSFEFDWLHNQSHWSSDFMGDFFYDHDNGDEQWYQVTGEGTWAPTGETSPLWYQYSTHPYDWKLSDGWSYTKYGGSSYWRLSDGEGGYDALFMYNHSTGQWYEHNGYTTNPYGTSWSAVGTAGILGSSGLLNGDVHDLGDGTTHRMDWSENTSYWTHDPLGSFRFDYEDLEWSMNHERMYSTELWWDMDAGSSAAFVFDNQSNWHSAGDGLVFKYNSVQNRTYWEYDQDGDGDTDQQFYFDITADQWYKYKGQGPQYWAYGDAGEDAFPWFLDNNNIPEITAPTAVQIINEAGGGMLFDEGNGNLISIADRDAYDGDIRVSLFASNGTMTLNAEVDPDLYVQQTGNGSDMIRIVGSIENINLVLDGLVFDADGDLGSGYSGWAGIMVGTNDFGYNGQAGTYGAVGDLLKIDIAVNTLETPANNAPVINAPLKEATDMGTPLVFSTENGNAIFIEDVDTGETVHAVKIVVPYGGEVSLNLPAEPEVVIMGFGDSSDLIFFEGDGVQDSVVFFSGSLEAINDALDGLTYQPPADFSGKTDGYAGLSINVIDAGVDGTGGPYTVSQWVQVAVDPVNDPVTIAVPDGEGEHDEFNVSAGGTLTFTGSNTISVSDPDSGDRDVQVQIKPVYGSLILAHLELSGTLTSFGGSPTGGYSMQGTVTEINAMLADLQFTANSGYSGWAGIQVVANDLGNSGGYYNGGVTALEMIDINVDAGTVSENTAPENSVPAWQTVVNNTYLVFSGENAISIGDTESSGTDPVAVMLYSANGTMSLSTSAGLTFREGTWQNSSFMRFSGTYDTVNAALEGMIYTPDMGYTGWANINIYTNDMGFYGYGGPMADSDFVVVKVLPADNTAPVNSMPVVTGTSDPDLELYVDQNGTLEFTGDSEIQISDSVSGAVSVKLLTYNGILTVADDGPGGADGATVFNNGTSGVGIAGTVSAVNGVLATLTFTPTAGYTGWSELAVLTNDGGPFGGDWANGLMDIDKVDIAVGVAEGSTPPNNAPVFESFPESQTMQEDSVLIFNTAHNNLISVSNQDDPTGAESTGALRLYASGGTMSLSPEVRKLIEDEVLAIDFTVGDGENDQSMYFSGTLADINAAIDGLIFKPDPNYTFGRASILVEFADSGYWGTGTDLTDMRVTDTILISVDPVNDVIVNMFGNGAGGMQPVPMAYQTAQDTALQFTSAAGNMIQVSDWADEATLENYPPNYLMQQVTLKAEHGTIHVSTSSSPQYGGFSITGNDTNTVTITGAQWDINGALADSDEPMTFTPETGYTGYASIVIFSSDGGNIGGQSGYFDTDRIDITVGASQLFAENEAPMVWVPLKQSTAEGDPVTFSTAEGNAIVVFDADSVDDNLYMEIIATHGTVSLEGTAIPLLSFLKGDGTNDYGMRFLGSMDIINEALDGLVFQPDADHEGEASFVIFFHDAANNGVDGNYGDYASSVKWARASVLIDVGAPFDNDAPTADPQTVHAVEDVPLEITLTGDDGEAVQDPDQALAYFLDSLPDEGTLYATEKNAVDGENPLEEGLLVTGSTVWFVSDPNSVGDGDTSFTFHVMDEGDPELESGPATVNVSIAPANDAPVIDNTGDMTLTTITEDQTNNPGNTVAQILTSDPGVLDAITDVDDGALEGIALTAVDNVLGTWQFSLDGGMSWVNVGDVSTSSALLLRSIDLVRFVPGGENGGTASVSFVAWDQTAYSAGRWVDASTTGGSTPFSVDSENATITISAVNDAPVNTIPTVNPQTVGVGGDLYFNDTNGNRIRIDDVDAGASDLRVTLISNNGVMHLNTATVTPDYLEGTTNDSAYIRFTATLDEIDALLNGLKFTAGSEGWANITVTCNDQGNTGVHPQGYNEGLGDGDKIDIIVGNPDPPPSVNQAPTVAYLPSTNLAFNEDTTWTFSDANTWNGSSTKISVSDPEFQVGVDDYYMAVKIRAINGTVTLAYYEGNEGGYDFSWLDGDGLNDGMVFFAGDQTALNAALNGMVFTPTANYNGPARVEVVVMDLGAEGVGVIGGIPAPTMTGIGLGGKTVFMNINPVNDAPVNTIPDPVTNPQSTGVDVDLVFDDLHGNRILMDDVDLDEGTGELRVGLISNNGIMYLNPAAIGDLTFLEETDNGSDYIRFTGTLEEVNAALDGLTFRPDTGYEGWANVTVTNNDMMNTGAHPQGLNEGLGDADKIDITVGSPGTLPDNYAPTNSVPSTTTSNRLHIDEDTTWTFSDTDLWNAASTKISVTDPEFGAGDDYYMSVKIRAFGGTVTLAYYEGYEGGYEFSWVDGDGYQDGMVFFAGDQNAINAALDGMTFTPFLNYSGGPAEIQIITTDLGAEGMGVSGGVPAPTMTGIGVDVDGVYLYIDPVNDDPVGVDDPGYSTDEDTVLNISAAGVLANDYDIDGAWPLEVSAVDDSLTDGIVTWYANGGFTYDPNGQFDDLAGGAFTTDSWTYTVSDGNGGEDTATVMVTINGVDDAPIVSLNSGACTLDATFSSDGLAGYDYEVRDNVIRATAIDAEGRVVVAGYVTESSTSLYRWAVARYTADGILDTSFDADGVAVITSMSTYWGAESVAIQADGKIVAAGYGPGNNFAVVRFNTDGTLDTAGFGGGDGIVTNDTAILQNTYAPDCSVAIQADGKILIAGTTTYSDFCLVRLNSDGTPDTTFGGDGKVTTLVGSQDQGRSIAIQSDGKIVVAGTAYVTGTANDFALVRYNVDGSLDDGGVDDLTPGDSFGTGGKVTTPFSGVSADHAYAVAIQSDGKIVAAGSSAGNFAIARYNVDGSPDGTFSTDGIHTTDVGSGNDVGESMVIQPDGKIVVVGQNNA
ncbi:MAG: cadherin-like domain-containing protein, partial [Pseudomonadota bacterium]